MKIQDTEQLRRCLEAHLYWAVQSGVVDTPYGPGRVASDIMSAPDCWSGFLDRALELLEGSP